MKLTLSFGIIVLLGVIGNLFFTTPTELGPKGVLAWFAFLFLSLVVLVAAIIKKTQRRSAPEAILFSIIISLLPVLVLAFSSLHQLNLVDILVLSFLVLIITFYTTRRRK